MHATGCAAATVANQHLEWEIVNSAHRQRQQIERSECPWVGVTGGGVISEEDWAAPREWGAQAIVGAGLLAAVMETLRFIAPDETVPPTAQRDRETSGF